LSAHPNEQGYIKETNRKKKEVIVDVPKNTIAICRLVTAVVHRVLFFLLTGKWKNEKRKKNLSLTRALNTTVWSQECIHTEDDDVFFCKDRYKILSFVFSWRVNQKWLGEIFIRQFPNVMYLVYWHFLGFLMRIFYDRIYRLRLLQWLNQRFIYHRIIFR